MLVKIKVRMRDDWIEDYTFVNVEEVYVVNDAQTKKDSKGSE